jgi:hypothetical protein
VKAAASRHNSRRIAWTYETTAGRSKSIASSCSDN